MMKALLWIATLKGAKLEMPYVLHEGQFRFFNRKLQKQATTRSNDNGNFKDGKLKAKDW
jgi:hypothetical protein